MASTNKSGGEPGSDRSLMMYWALAGLVTLLGFVIAWRYAEPPPPSHVHIAAGERDGAYYAFAKQYAEYLAREDIELEVVETAGSVENVQLLQGGDCDLGFIQGGVGSHFPDAPIESLASLYFEPLEVFFRAPLDIEYLKDVQGLRVAVGEQGSGTRLLALELLAQNGVTEDSATLFSLKAAEAAKRLRSGELDAAFFVSSASGNVVSQLFLDESLRLLSFRRHLAYRSRHRYLSSVVLGEGSIDLVRNLPPRDTTLLAPAASLVSRQGFHPALVTLMLKAAEHVHRQGGLFEEPGEFPSAHYTEYPLRPQAQSYLNNGPSFLHRYLPFWWASMIDRLKIMLVPLLTLLIPLIRIAPPVYRWRVRSKIYRWYGYLRALDLRLEQRRELPIDLEREQADLDALEQEFNTVSVPLAYMDEFYELRMHIQLVRENLRKITEEEGEATGSAKPSPDQVRR
jgi:TRAP transporter TAXI family solute receptor